MAQKKSAFEEETSNAPIRITLIERNRAGRAPFYGEDKTSFPARIRITRGKSKNINEKNAAPIEKHLKVRYNKYGEQSLSENRL